MVVVVGWEWGGGVVGSGCGVGGGVVVVVTVVGWW